jgi:ATP-dependent DNA helicase 2 subunit 2
LEGGKITTIGSMNPIADFEAMIETKQPIKIRTAVHGIQAQIENLFLHGKQFYPKAIQTLRHFRLKSPEVNACPIVYRIRLVIYLYITIRFL